nr:MAG TPA: hypothetical protein [Caudoviricetes sp.]DAO72655.1 MAG TPA: hypothetical protein [Caudoviricetes sp.]
MAVWRVNYQIFTKNDIALNAISFYYGSVF